MDGAFIEVRCTIHLHLIIDAGNIKKLATRVGETEVTGDELQVTSNELQVTSE